MNSCATGRKEVICQFLSRYALSSWRTKTLEARGLCLDSFYTTFTKVHFLRQTIYGQRALSGWCIFSNIGLHINTKRVFVRSNTDQNQRFYQHTSFRVGLNRTWQVFVGLVPCTAISIKHWTILHKQRVRKEFTTSRWSQRKKQQPQSLNFSFMFPQQLNPAKIIPIISECFLFLNFHIDSEG